MIVLATAVALAGLRSRHGVSDLTSRAGGLDRLAFLLIGLAAVAALVPASLVAGTGGFLYGTVTGTALAIVAVGAGSLLAFHLARKIGGQPYRHLGGARLRALTERIERRGFLTVLYARLLPGSPLGLVNYAAGLTGISWQMFLLATVLGYAPRAFVYASLGGHLDDLTAPAAQIAIGLTLAMAMAGVLIWLAERQRDRRMARRPFGSSDGP